MDIEPIVTKLINAINRLKTKTLPNLFINNLRIILAFGFIPSGITKINNHPFTNFENTGPFFDYFDALYKTGFYYQFIGWAQVLAALLLFSYRFSTLGIIFYFPIILNICVFTLSTHTWGTALITTLMTCGSVLLLVWDLNRIKSLFIKNSTPIPEIEINKYQVWEKTGLLLILNTIIPFLCGKFFGRTIISKISLLLYIIIPLFASVIFIIKRHRASK